MKIYAQVQELQADGCRSLKSLWLFLEELTLSIFICTNFVVRLEGSALLISAFLL